MSGSAPRQPGSELPDFSLFSALFQILLIPLLIHLDN